ncbi:MAG: hypothetical protein LBQ52_01910, partial [Helicobacteraceae bacterium]|nr:hypothetical protein [Helicobacteraceae bacterium]
IDSDESVALLKIALEERLVDFYKIGAVSGMQVDIDWEAFLSAAIATLNAYDAKYYVKEELRALAPKAASALTREQTDMDAYPVPAFQLSTTGQKNERKPPHPPPRYDGTR